MLLPKLLGSKIAPKNIEERYYCESLQVDGWLIIEKNGVIIYGGTEIKISLSTN